MREERQHDARRGIPKGNLETAAREAELVQWLTFNPEPAAINCDAASRSTLLEMGVELSSSEEELLARYLGMLFATNERFNLTRIDAESAWSRHIVDSLTLLAPLASIEDARAGIDVGSGGGLPGIPLAIARPDIAWTLVESTGKKARFLEGVARKLGLTNVAVLQERAEVAARGASREAFDVATSRAVGALDGLAQISIPLLRVGGLMLAIKGERAPEEVVAAKQTLYELHAAVVGELRTASNTIIVIEKRRKTPAKFP
jgi:16S rRNA (guanine527-N7)-methyltransferase